MLYVLPLPRAPDPPSPWDSIICSTTTNGGNNNNQDRTTWSNRKHPPKVRLREFHVVKKEVIFFFK